ncbi:MAG: protein GlmU [Deltaproteobacteria bacterium]|nr:protein GlmU [Deltaproteobacteria bacterium]
MSKIDQLIKKGVKIAAPCSIEIGDEVNIDDISGEGVTLYAGVKIFGESTVILKNCSIGYEAPVTIDNCQIGVNVKLAGGYFNNAVFLKKASAGSCAHVREATILEEEASIAHTVGLKHTILFPYVALGSLINFCDCLMTGGASIKNHSEVGSSFIHFNYTPAQDKATPSIFGDVFNGVMLNKNPIFLGGQGGVVGPCRLAFGTVTPAGTICRKDEYVENRLVINVGAEKTVSIPYKKKIFGDVKRIITNNVNYLANLTALYVWYKNIRANFISQEFTKQILSGLLQKTDMAISERIKRFKEFLNNANFFYDIAELEDIISEKKKTAADIKYYEPFLKTIEQNITAYGKDYIKVIKNLNEEQRQAGILWLNRVIRDIL